MKGLSKSFPLALRMIFTDPVNLILAIFPTIIAFAIYLFSVVYIWRNSDRFVAMFRGYIYTAEQATILASILTAILIIFMFFLMSWTFIVVVGLISAPFNALLSSRIETKLVTKVFMNEDQKEAIEQVKRGMGQIFKNEFKKFGFILFMLGIVFILNMFPLFYPVGLILLATLLSVQFVDYSWSRHNMHFNACLKDVLKNFFPYTAGGFFFLFLMAVPLVNAFIPAFATSYFTVLYLHRQNKID